MSDLDDEGYDRLSDYALSGSESDFETGRTTSTPPTTPSIPHSKRPSDTRKLACHYKGCDKTFNRQARLNEHLRSHTNTRPFKCPHCPKDFLRDTHLKHHVKSAHSNVRDYTCSYTGCGKGFATGTRLRRHEATHSGKNKYICTGYEGCDQTFRKKETLSRHVLKDHEETKPFPCTDVNSGTGEMCKKKFDTAEKLRSHQRAVHDPTKFTCTICTQAQAMAYRDNTEFDYEVAVPYFSTYFGLKKHVDTAHPPTCGTCSLQFTTPKEISRHMEVVHSVVDPSTTTKQGAHPCLHEGCGRFFSKKGNLSVHVKTVHEKRRDFVCGQTEVSLPEITSDIELAGCGRDFTSKSTLEEHIRTAHMRMEAKRVGRNKKRRAEKQEAEEGDGLNPKRRRTRKDKGVKKSSAIQSLADGFPVYRRGSLGQADTYDSDEEDESDNYSVHDEDSSDDGLTSSMVMHGSHIFHGDNTFHFDSGSSSLSTQPPAEPMYQQVNHTDALAVDLLPKFDFEDLQFNHNFDFTDNQFLNLPSTMLPLDSQQEAGMPASQPTQCDLMTEDWYHLQQQAIAYTQLSLGNVPVDPLLSA